MFTKIGSVVKNSRRERVEIFLRSLLKNTTRFLTMRGIGRRYLEGGLLVPFQ